MKKNFRRITGWSLAAFLLLLPLMAMQFTNEVNWDRGDFAVFGAMLLAAGLAIEFSVKVLQNKTHRAFAGAAVVAAFLLVWVKLATG